MKQGYYTLILDFVVFRGCHLTPATVEFVAGLVLWSAQGSTLFANSDLSQFEALFGGGGLFHLDVLVEVMVVELGEVLLEVFSWAEAVEALEADEDATFGFLYKERNTGESKHLEHWSL